jgi:hypothetical protein
MASTWIGGGDNEASNPNDWSPTGVPSNTEDAVITHGKINIRGSVLAANNPYHLIVQGGDVDANLLPLNGQSPVVRPIDVESGSAVITVPEKQNLGSGLTDSART